MTKCATFFFLMAQIPDVLPANPTTADVKLAFGPTVLYVTIYCIDKFYRNESFSSYDLEDYVYDTVRNIYSIPISKGDSNKIITLMSY